MVGSQPEIDTVAVVGAGTMGVGIAQVSTMGGLRTLVFDPDKAVRESVLDQVAASFDRGAKRGFWSGSQASIALGRLEVVDSLPMLAEAGLIIEAVPELLELKQQIFGELEDACGPDSILATNTSSLSVTAIASVLDRPQRMLGLHFFNPVQAMRLVEVISGERTSPAHAERARETVTRMNKVAIRAKDAIGFVANRCARPFTLEAMRMSAELGLAPAEIDRICRVGAGFRMGPFELVDLVGADINLTVAHSFFKQSFGEPRWRPSQMQLKMVNAGWLGRKSGRGFYDYSESSYREPDPAVTDRQPIEDHDRLVELAGPRSPEVIRWMAAQIVNEGVFTLASGIASEADIDTAMLKGFNWPVGPIEWGRRIGFQTVVETLEELRDRYGEAYRPAPLLRKMT